MHVGKKNNVCSENLIDTFHLESAKRKATSILDMVDVEGEKHCMETVTSWTYLGDKRTWSCKTNYTDAV